MSWVWLFALAACAPAQSGPTDAQAACRLPSDCPRGMSCLAGSCVFECREDRDCVAIGRGAACDTSTGLCRMAPGDGGPTDAATAPDTTVATDAGVATETSTAPDGPVPIDVDQPDRVTPVDLGSAVDGAVPDAIEAVVENSPLQSDCADCGSGTSPYGAMIGSYRGVIAYSNGDTWDCHRCADGAALGLACGSRCSPSFTSPQTQYGLAWQCIEYVRRFYATVYGDTALATSTGDAAQYARGLPAMGFTAMLNGVSRVAPQPDDILVWTGGGHGHIAVVRAVGASTVTVIQQNAARSPADNAFAIPMTSGGGVYTLGPSPSPLGGLTIAGWYRRPTNDWRRCGDARACPDGYACISGRCMESGPAPDCTGRTCGPDPVTGASCGTCATGTVCSTSGTCVPSCTSPRQVCGAVCTDTNNDVSNCGRCGNACTGGQTCSGGSCSCGGGRQFCGGTCVDTGNDNGNCGRCGNACATSQTCSGGSCVCTGGRQLCGGSCVDTGNDNNHCGGCGVACVAPTRCSASRCALTCASGETACSPTTCANLNGDLNNCGRCGNACTGGQTCSGGSCSCGSGREFCGGTCVDTGNDSGNCGRCGNACAPSQTCSGGSCVCTGGRQACGGACVDTSGDNGNCGRCGNACAGGQTCSGGSCSCGGGRQFCGGACVDTGNDNGNCGRCGNACATAQTCSGGSCVCTGGRLLCGGSCVDTGTNPSNCGACGRVCGSGQSCLGGSCASPAIGMTSPPGGGSYAQGATFTVAWTSSNTTGYVRVVVRRYGSEVVPVTTTGAASGSQAVTVPSSWAAGGGYDICASVNSAIGVITDCRAFSVTASAPTISMTSPSSGSAWGRGQTFTASWTSSNTTGYVRVVVRRYGSEIVPVTTTGAASASQAVTVPGSWASGSGYDICASVNSAVGVITDCRGFSVL